MVVTEPNGAMRAMVGGMDYGKSQFNRAIVSTRQPGSSFKLVRLRRRLRACSDYTPDTDRRAAPRLHRRLVPAQLFGRNSVGRISLELGLRAVDQHRAGEPLDQDRPPAHRRAAPTAWASRNDFPVTRSLALGAASVTVIDMTSAYAVFANRRPTRPRPSASPASRTLSGDADLRGRHRRTPRERVLTSRPSPT